jgi:hypothetical protein
MISLRLFADLICSFADHVDLHYIMFQQINLDSGIHSYLYFTSSYLICLAHLCRPTFAYHYSNNGRS